MSEMGSHKDISVVGLIAEMGIEGALAVEGNDWRRMAQPSSARRVRMEGQGNDEREPFEYGVSWLWVAPARGGGLSVSKQHPWPRPLPCPTPAAESCPMGRISPRCYQGVRVSESST